MAGHGFIRFIVAGLSGNRFGDYSDETVNQNRLEADSLAKAESEELKVVIEEGRRQLDRQAIRMSAIETRAQILIGVALTISGFLFNNLDSADRLGDLLEYLSRGLLSLGIAFNVLSSCGAAAIVATKAVFAAPDTTRTANAGGDLRVLARSYAESVILGENTVAARVTHMRRSVVSLVLGAICGFAGIVIVEW